MASIDFVAHETVVPATWLNEINRTQHDILGNPSNAADVRAAISVDSSAEVTAKDNAILADLASTDSGKGSELVAKTMNVINVKDYGAIGDGIADDRFAILAALNAAKASGGGTVFFPTGSYKITSVINLDPSYANITLQGSGMSASKVICDFDGITFNFTSPDESSVLYTGLLVQNMTFDCDGHANTIFKIKNRVNIKFSWVQFLDGEYAIFTPNDGAANSVNSMVIEHCRIIGHKYGIWFGNYANVCSIVDTQIITTSWSVVVYSTVNVSLRSVTFNGVYTDSNSGALWLGGCITFLVDDCAFEGNATYGAHVVVANTEIDGTTATRLTTKNGLIRLSHHVSAGGTNYGIQLNNVSGVIVEASQAGSGMALALVRAQTGTNRCMFINCTANSGNIVSYQTSSDANNNLSITNNIFSRIKVSEGSPSLPAYTFGEQNTDGMYSRDPTSIGFALEGEERGYISTNGWNGGVGIDQASTGHFSNLYIDNSATPATSSSTGTAGRIVWDSNYIYICIASDTWKRVAITTW